MSLTPELDRAVREKVASGLYNNASEVIREALRLSLKKDAENEWLKRATRLGNDPKPEASTQWYY